MDKFECLGKGDDVNLKLMQEVLQEAQLEHLSTFRNLEKSRVQVFIDPLDGTRQFVKGELSGVTVMIGLCYDGIPVAGVI